ncbi:hypothetical protein TNCV_3761421 [Trichonephila clavipes]|nr:hypothetical protein TNCV_3761421 [Trichonephila clavipes]
MVFRATTNDMTGVNVVFCRDEFRELLSDVSVDQAINPSKIWPAFSPCSNWLGIEDFFSGAAFVHTDNVTRPFNPFYLDEVNDIEAREIHRAKGLEVRLSLALSTIQVTVRFSSVKFPEETIDGDNTYLHLHNFCMKLKGREIFSNLCARDSSHKTLDPLIYRARTPCVLGEYLVASSIEPRPSGLESDALTTRLPTA